MLLTFDGDFRCTWRTTGADPTRSAIVHTESTFVNVLGALGRRIDPVLLNMVLYAKGPVPVMPFEFSTNAASAAQRRADGRRGERGRLGQPRAARSRQLPALAFKVAVAVEENAEVLYHAERAGTPRVLVYDEIEVPEGTRLP